MSLAPAPPSAYCRPDTLIAEHAVRAARPPAMKDKDQIAIGLTKRILSGDRSAENELISQYGGGLLIMLRQRTGDHQLANDLYQETFMIVIRRLRRAYLDEPNKLGAFIHATAKNILIGDYRKEARRKTFADSDIVAEVPDWEFGPLDRVSQIDEARVVHELINKMPSERDKAILLRFYINEEDKENICSDLNLSSIHFNRVLFRARRRFKELLVQFEQNDGERIKGQ